MSSLAHCCHKFCLLLIVIAVLACLLGGELLAKTPVGSSVAEPQQIEQWAIELDDDRFDTRQRAQQQLERAGKPAITAVAGVAESGSLESATRAVNILLQWSEAKEQGLRIASLEKLASLPNRPRESAMATRLLADVREQAAVQRLSNLGAKVSRDVQIPGAGHLQVVIGPDWDGGSEGLKHLADVPHVTTISLHVAPLDDSAIDYLVKVPQVRRVELYGTDFSPEAVAKLKQQLPANTKVEERGGAMLGIRGNVESVVPNSAAHKAGIQARDRIIEFNGEKVADFDALTQRIAKKKPGDTVTLTVLRNQQSRKVKVTFDQWGTRSNLVVKQQPWAPGQVPPGFPPPRIIVPAK